MHANLTDHPIWLFASFATFSFRSVFFFFLFSIFEIIFTNFGCHEHKPFYNHPCISCLTLLNTFITVRQERYLLNDDVLMFFFFSVCYIVFGKKSIHPLLPRLINVLNYYPSFLQRVISRGASTYPDKSHPFHEGFGRKASKLEVTGNCWRYIH